jgi:hypothetical protein
MPHTFKLLLAATAAVGDADDATIVQIAVP